MHNTSFITLSQTKKKTKQEKPPPTTKHLFATKDVHRTSKSKSVHRSILLLKLGRNPYQQIHQTLEMAAEVFTKPTISLFPSANLFLQKIQERKKKRIPTIMSTCSQATLSSWKILAEKY